MTTELYWAVMTAMMTSLLWMPHIVQRIIEMKPYAAFRDPRHDVPTKAPWAQRAIRAHTNAVENLAVFGLLAVAIDITHAGTALTGVASPLYFWARVAHYVIYVLGIPWLRTPIFLVGLSCQLLMGATLLSTT